MAKKEAAKKIVLERTYIVPLRREFQKAPNWYRTPRAVKALRAFILRHMKAKELAQVKLGSFLNAKLWERGIMNPPHKVKIECIKDEDGMVTAELFGAPKQKALGEKKSAKEKAAPEVPAKEDEKSVEISVKEALGGEEMPKAEQAKLIEKEEIRELKKEHHPQHAPKHEAVPHKIVHHTTGGPKQKG